MSPVKHTVPRDRPHPKGLETAAKPRRAPVLSKWLLAWLYLFAAHSLPAQPSNESEATPAAEETAPPLVVEDPPTPTPQPSVAGRLAEQQRQLLYQLNGPPSALWLPVDDQQVLAFWQPDRSGTPLGAVLMLHDWGDSPRHPATLRRLHEYLPLHGWATFSMELPDLPPATIPARANPAPAAVVDEEPLTKEDSETAGEESLAEEAPETADEGTLAMDSPEATEEAPVAREPAEDSAAAPSEEEIVKQIHRRIHAATTYLHQQGQYNLILLGEGRSALWVLQHLEQALPPPEVSSENRKSTAVIERTFRAVVLVNAETPNPATPLATELRSSDIPTLDVFTDFHLDARAAAQSRRQAARQHGYSHYVIRRLPPPSGADSERSETPLTKTVRGFLQKYAQGVELE